MKNTWFPFVELTLSFYRRGDFSQIRFSYITSSHSIGGIAQQSQMRQLEPVPHSTSANLYFRIDGRDFYQLRDVAEALIYEVVSPRQTPKFSV